MAAPTIFVSYSHADGTWKDRLLKHLSPWRIVVWTDDMIRPGAVWKDSIDAALKDCAGALLLLSPDYLSSAFIMREELPLLLRRAASGSLQLFCVHVAANAYETTDLSLYQALNTPEQPLNGLTAAAVDGELKRISRAIAAAVSSRRPDAPPSGRPRTEMHSDHLESGRIDIDTATPAGEARDVVIKSGTIRTDSLTIGTRKPSGH